MEGTCVVFIDPEELSYHNFENILPVDCVFERNQNQSEDGDQQQQQLAFSLSDKKTFEKKEDVVSFTLTGSTSSLLDLEELNLYNPVLNEGSRGGKRFIFQSSLLSKALTEAVKETGHFEQSFRFVNYVFRLNKFEPSDRKFESHYDTPYYDRDNRHISRFTLLIYLTGGKGKPVLRIEDLFLDQIEKMTCVIFPQSLEHEVFYSFIFLPFYYFSPFLFFVQSFFSALTPSTTKNRESLLMMGQNCLFVLNLFLKIALWIITQFLDLFFPRFLLICFFARE